MQSAQSELAQEIVAKLGERAGRPALRFACLWLASKFHGASGGAVAQAAEMEAYVRDGSSPWIPKGSTSSQPALPLGTPASKP